MQCLAVLWRVLTKRKTVSVAQVTPMVQSPELHVAHIIYQDALSAFRGKPSLKSVEALGAAVIGFAQKVQAANKDQQVKNEMFGQIQATIVKLNGIHVKSGRDCPTSLLIQDLHGAMNDSALYRNLQCIETISRSVIDFQNGHMSLRQVRDIVEENRPAGAFLCPLRAARYFRSMKAKDRPTGCFDARRNFVERFFAHFIAHVESLIDNTNVLSDGFVAKPDEPVSSSASSLLFYHSSFLVVFTQPDDHVEQLLRLDL